MVRQAFSDDLAGIFSGQRKLPGNRALGERVPQKFRGNFGLRGNFQEVRRRPAGIPQICGMPAGGASGDPGD
ncbi:hypothetical protein IOD16_37585 [Saccharothrix sp. 6-C]|uniref:hypothetical protein n=1 Tax=Saccharothrix sp. 6-C TaxID=2781735 RepID=UPI001916FB01|nr:hypothetical protein [Saccharothrix sp. 6-C]QQQ76629.1 hypothetical protein IOD16_37585 [Saccharothrix sp. 6-C]